MREKLDVLAVCLFLFSALLASASMVTPSGWEWFYFPAVVVMSMGHVSLLFAKRLMMFSSAMVTVATATITPLFLGIRLLAHHHGVLEMSDCMEYILGPMAGAAIIAMCEIHRRIVCVPLPVRR